MAGVLKMKKLNALPILIAALFGAASPALSFTGVGNRGGDFWLALPGIYVAGTMNWSVALSSGSNASGQVSVPGLGFSTGFSVTAGNVSLVPLPLAAMDSLSDAVTTLGVHVTANQDIAVYAFETQNRGSESYLGLSTGSLGTQYMVLSFPADLSASKSEFTIVGTQNGTAVTITPSQTVGSRAAGVPYPIVLNQGDVYQLQDGNSGDDLTGTSITSSLPIGVWGVNACADVPVSNLYCNPLVEQLWPIPYWGTAFVASPTAARLNGDRIRFLASANGTNVSVNGAPVAALNQGQVFETVLTAPSYITSNNPIYTAQYTNSSSIDYPTPSPTPAPGDPMMASLVPVNYFDNDYVFAAPGTIFPANYANVYVPTASLGLVLLDGAAIPAGQFTAIGASGYWGTAVTLVSGPHHLSGPQAFGAMLYGFAIADAYGNPGGLMFATATPTPTLTPCGYPGPLCTPTFTVTPTFTFTPTLTPTPSPTLTPTCVPHAWPDPFNPNFAFKGYFKVDCLPPGVTVTFYTLSGERVAALGVSGGRVEWDGRNEKGILVVPGIYFYVIQEGDRVSGRGKFLVNH